MWAIVGWAILGLFVVGAIQSLQDWKWFGTRVLGRDPRDYHRTRGSSGGPTGLQGAYSRTIYRPPSPSVVARRRWDDRYRVAPEHQAAMRTLAVRADSAIKAADGDT